MAKNHPPAAVVSSSNGDRPAVETQVAARICWHTYRICRALRESLDELQDALAEIAEHCDALIELALEHDPGGQTNDGGEAREGPS